MRVAGSLVATLLLLAGCAAPDPAPTSTPESAEVPPAALAQLREEYGLPDCPDTDPAAEPVEGGLPRTALPCLGSDKVVNLAGLPRRPMVINLWAQWCGPCREEAPFLRELHRTRDDVDLYGINYNDPKPDWALEFASLVEWDYPHIQDLDKTLQTSLGVPGIPMTVLVDAEGVIRYRHPGPFESTEQLESLIEEHL
ncbi:TlpA family protein disulfide reductase [Tessaracoccus oleiagri]|uniref:Thiol-disulfide isomerase or thioredoxin n=1 Tax=Tessaracoccus oleiagri TaxID=686624 RepID=A0A1G9MZC9_9ACTN|nr:TlpA disulfide reductase family protein [Tessaracoccus oleiagri]SDL79640.1 Thiol-disulfide isomerase or thioredoxin [Tessaracoccus oleiagri]